MSTKNQYDLIFSLGGNCSVSHNLRFRNQRPFSLPFDWLYMENDKPIRYLVEGFENNFKNFALEKNLVELTKEEKSSAHNDRVQYKDIYTGYFLVNHFNKSIAFKEEYQRVHNLFQKRFARLLNYITKSKNVLILLATPFEIQIQTLYPLKKLLEKLYPTVHFDYKILCFNAKEEKTIKENNIQISFYHRDFNLYDFTQTNWEWNFLDSISLSQNIVPKSLGRVFKLSCKLFGSRYKLELTKKKIE